MAVTPRDVVAALAAACLTLALLLATARAAEIDPAASAIGFTLKTRWGKTLIGHFPRYEGEVATLPDGRHQVRLRLAAAEVEIDGSSTFTRLTRGEGFFEADRFPWVEFVSDPYSTDLTRHGGRLGGRVTIRGVERRESFVIRPAVCERPGVECDIVARGSIDRDDYGMGRWGFALSDKVVFSLRVRTVPESDA
ncbi:YceI family protein [Luteimonas sp. 22616]|uniref:YceI family protein n=1 Tax=Luteimonas sp. 22616 TaxID=3453951 RepID=UPI003F86D212